MILRPKILKCGYVTVRRSSGRALEELVSAIWVLVIMLSVTAVSQTSSNHTKPKQSATSRLASRVLPAPDPLPAQSPPRNLEQMPPRAPRIEWDGKQLSIKSENATLADVLVAIRTNVGLAIEIPPGAARERVAVELGPASAREVLTSLLAGSNFDYIIQASGANEEKLQSVLITPRGRTDDADRGGAIAAGPRVPRSPGYPSPVPRDPEPTLEPGPEDAPSQASTTSSPVIPSQGTDPASVRAEAISVHPPQPGDADSSAALPETHPGSEVAVQASEQPVAPSVATPAESEASSKPGSAASQMRQNLQNMYEQRRRLQAQQNQSNSGSSN
jgi:hypothetical protein